MENKYYTANTYQNWEKIGDPYKKNNKLYTIVKKECPRCNGLGIIVSRVENGHIIPIPVANGICFQCEGKKFIKKEVRLYTELEYNRMNESNEKNKIKRAEAREKAMKENFEKNKAIWLKTNGFSEDGITYIIIGDSYSIKDELKKAGFYYDPVLKWHRSTPDGYEDKVIKVNLNEIIEFSAEGKGYYITNAKNIIDTKLATEENEEISEWYSNIGDKIKNIKVQLTKHSSFTNRWGLSNIYTFKDNNSHVFIWFTTKNLNYKIDDFLLLSGTIKNHNQYKNTKQTIVTRCNIMKAD